jgi:acetyl-CoA acyltransferase
VSLDEGPRPDTSLEGLAKLRPVFAARGSVTAGNSSQTSDGAGALILASEKAVKQFGLTPLARFCQLRRTRRAARDHGHRPHRGHSRGAALRRPAQLDDIGWIELNEAFAAQSLAVMNTWAWTRPRSTPWAVPSPWATRWAPPEPSAGHRDARAAPPQAEVRHGDHVRGHRPGRSRHF